MLSLLTLHLPLSTCHVTFDPYLIQVGEVMDGRYEVFASYGRGVFGSVVRARDLASAASASAVTKAAREKEEGGPGGGGGAGGGGGKPSEVAIKLIRSNEVMFKAAQTEIQILKLLGDYSASLHLPHPPVMSPVTLDPSSPPLSPPRRCRPTQPQALREALPSL